MHSVQCRCDEINLYGPIHVPLSLSVVNMLVHVQMYSIHLTNNGGPLNRKIVV